MQPNTLTRQEYKGKIYVKNMRKNRFGSTTLYFSMEKYVHCKKNVTDFSIPNRDVTNQTLPGLEFFNYSRPWRVWLVTSRLGTGKTITFFTVYECVYLCCQGDWLWLLPCFLIKKQNILYKK